MARRLKGFRSAGVVAAFSETGEVGRWNDINAPRNAPALDPVGHLDRVAFHSAFYLYERAFDQVVNVQHPSIPSDRISEGFTGSLGITWAGRVAETSHVLVNHGLPYTPLVIAAYQGAMVLSGTIVQTEWAGSRFVSLWASTTQAGLGECAYSNEDPLPGVTRSYRIVVFRTPAPDPNKALFSGNGDGFQLGRGMVDSEAAYMRRAPAATAPLSMDVARTVDLANGGARVVTGGNVHTDSLYTGSFAGGQYLPVDI